MAILNRKRMEAMLGNTTLGLEWKHTLIIHINIDTRHLEINFHIPVILNLIGEMHLCVPDYTPP